MEYLDTGEFVDDNDWQIHYPEAFTRWLANLVKISEYRWLPHEILECERRYPHLIDDILTQLGYRAALERETD